MQTFLNGTFLSDDDAQVGVNDAGLQHAVGLFETMAAHHGRIFRLDQHLQRLATSAQQLGLARELDTQPLAEAVQQTLTQNQLTDARVRLTLTAGEVSMLKPTEPKPTVLIQATPPTQYDPAYFQQGVTVLIGPPIHNPFDTSHGHKTLNYWPRLRTLRQAASAQAAEAICLQVSNHLAAGCISNVFIVQDGKLLTPLARGDEAPNALPAPVLPGVTRAAVLELAERQNIPARAQMLSVDDLLDADEVFLTNSSWQVLPVKAVEQHPISDGIGPVTAMLREALLQEIESQTQAG